MIPINQNAYLQPFIINPLLSFAVCSLSAFKMNQIFVKQMHLLNLSRKKTQITKKVFFCVMQLNAAVFSLTYPTASALVLIAGYITALAISRYLPKPTLSSQPRIEEQSLSNKTLLNKILAQEGGSKEDFKTRFKMLTQIAKFNPVLHATAQKKQVRIINEHPEISTLSFFDSFEEMIFFAKTQGIDKLNLSKATLSDKQMETLVHELPNLKELNISCSYIIPSTSGIQIIAHLTHLSFLDMEGCYGVDDADLQVIVSHLTNLTHLNISDCKFGDICLQAIVSNLKQLSFLNINRCFNLSATGIQELANLTNLTHLNVSNCAINQPSLHTIALHLTKLTHLNISGCAINDSCLQAVAPHLANLTSLEIRTCDSFGNIGFQAITLHLTKLTFLDISCLSENVTTVGLQSLAYLKNLTSLKMGLCSGLDEVSLQTISSNLTELTHLDISLCKTAGLQAIANLKNLTDLQMSNCPKLDDTSLQAIASNLKKLTKLNISPSSTVTAAGIQSLAKLTNLTHLQMYGCRGIDDASLQEIASHLTKLTELNIFGSNVTTTGIKALALLKNLTHLNIEKCGGVDDSSLQTIASSLQNLIELDISECDNVSSNGIQKLRALKNLNCLNMEKCNGVDDFSLMTAIPSLTKLVKLDISDCRISMTGIQIIASHCPNLSSLFVRNCCINKKDIELLLPKVWIFD